MWDFCRKLRCHDISKCCNIVPPKVLFIYFWYHLVPPKVLFIFFWYHLSKQRLVTCIYGWQLCVEATSSPSIWPGSRIKSTRFGALVTFTQILSTRLWVNLARVISVCCTDIVTLLRTGKIDSLRWIYKVKQVRNQGKSFSLNIIAFLSLQDARFRKRT